MWFETSDECPVCRADQTHEYMITFKNKIEDKMRLIYKDAIDSLEHELRTSRQTIVSPSYNDTVRGFDNEWFRV